MAVGSTVAIQRCHLAAPAAAEMSGWHAAAAEVVHAGGPGCLVLYALMQIVHFDMVSRSWYILVCCSYLSQALPQANQALMSQQASAASIPYPTALLLTCQVKQLHTDMFFM